MEMFGLAPAFASIASMLIVLVILGGVFYFFYSAPPNQITISAGPPGSSFEISAQRYLTNLPANSGVKLVILPSEGSEQNLDRLEDKTQKVDVGFVQVGITNGLKTNHLVSLGSIQYVPMLVFYRAAQPVELLSAFAGQRLDVGPQGSGTRDLALQLLALNGIKPGGTTTLLDLSGEEGAQQLLAGKVDVLFLMGDSASPALMRRLLNDQSVRLFDFKQADGYVRRISYLNKLLFPRGSIDFGKDIPSQDVTVLGPTVELVARPGFDPALSDLLLEAAKKVHSEPSLMRHRHEFPAPMEYDLPMSPAATRFYQKGKPFIYKILDYRIASLLERIVVSFGPMLLVLIPTLRMIPAIFKWRMRTKIYHRYRALLALERDLARRTSPADRTEMRARLDEIESSVNRLRVPASFGDQFYGLRGHIDYVRARLAEPAEPAVH